MSVYGCVRVGDEVASEGQEPETLGQQSLRLAKGLSTSAFPSLKWKKM